MLAVSCRDVTFRYGKRTVLHGVSVDLAPGVTGLLGPNGAGKSTLLNILATIRRADSGDVMVAGHDLSCRKARLDARRSIGYLPQRFDLMLAATAQRNVEYSAWASGIPSGSCAKAAAQALDLVGLSSRAAERAGRLSGGQRQRLGIACAIAHEPEVLLLDEATVGIDPVERVKVRRHLQYIAETTAIVVSTHIVEDLLLTASRVLVLSDGRVKFEGDVAGLQELGQGFHEEGVSSLEGGYMALVGRDQ